MIWTIVKADLLWMVMTIPFYVGLNVALALYKRRQARHEALQVPAWARGKTTPAGRWKLAVMRSRRDRRRCRRLSY